MIRSLICVILDANVVVGFAISAMRKPSAVGADDDVVLALASSLEVLACLSSFFCRCSPIPPCNPESEYPKLCGRSLNLAK